MQNTNTNAVPPNHYVKTQIISIIPDDEITECSTIVPVAFWLLLLAILILVVGMPV